MFCLYNGLPARFAVSYHFGPKLNTQQLQIQSNAETPKKIIFVQIKLRNIF